MSRHDSNANRFQLEPLEDRLLFSGDSLYVVPIGDSITYGVDALHQAGYRGPLEDLLQSAGQGHAFTGTLDDLSGRPYSGVDQRGHFAVPGATAGEMLDYLTDNMGSGTPTFDILRDQGTSPDFVLLHLGTNNFVPNLTTDDLSAGNEMSDLLDYLHGPEGIDSGTQILLAQIIPRATYGDTWDAEDFAALYNVAQYNYSQLPALQAAYADSVSMVDMFRIDISTLSTLTAQERALANTDGDTYIDWIHNFNETDPFNYANISATTGLNTALFDDNVHPTALGYKIMAEVWSQAILGQYVPQPDPDPGTGTDPGTDPGPIGVNVGLGLQAYDFATGSGYIMYTEQDIHSRFNHPDLNNASFKNELARNLIVVKLINGVWHMDGNYGNYQAFTPRPTDVLLASVDFDNDTVTSLQGTSGTVAGIQSGYASGNLDYFADQWDGGFNNGDFQVTGTYFQLSGEPQPDPDPGTGTDPGTDPGPIGVNVGLGLQAYDFATGSGYIMYTEQDIHSRFNHPDLNNASFKNELARNLIVVKLINGVWHMDGNYGNYQAFTPRPTDVLLASVDFDNDTVTSLQGTSGTIAGIQSGYASGNLDYFADQWDGGFNNGDFQVTGTYFQLSGEPQPDPDPGTGTGTDPGTDPGPIGVNVGLGLQAYDFATGSGYIMYTEQDIHSRFNHPDLNNASFKNELARNLIVVKLINGVWHMDGNYGNYQAFTPRPTDVLLASVDFDNDTVTSLQGTSGTVAGIQSGYTSGNLDYFADQWDGGFNNGDFQVTGSTFTRNA